ncbi:hypothetical protein BCR39DRAFT_587868 [Naematelia encephala]|uniref:Uncharacterized protein n=1 Tax=Naematelia encephala TaxID=71784 RepID=A0A1Y2B6Y4_9TREE|nr:hypothetical protein BCR39DRAFT_587868 [Naematelia encephala]
MNPSVPATAPSTIFQAIESDLPVLASILSIAPPILRTRLILIATLSLFLAVLSSYGAYSLPIHPMVRFALVVLSFVAAAVGMIIVVISAVVIVVGLLVLAPNRFKRDSQAWQWR